MTEELDTTPPPILLNDPPPRSLLKSFHRRRIQVWEGTVAVDSVRGWINNRRTELHVQTFRTDFGRDPDDEELYQLVLDDEFQKIKPLADNIYKNGVRVPVIVSSDGRLLDGNRRYFSVKFLLESLKPSERGEFKTIPAWVLASSTTPEDEFNVITERNLVDDQKIQWPYYVQALQVYEDHVDDGMAIKEIADKYDKQTSRIRQMIAAVELAQEFVAYHEDKGNDSAASRIVYENLIWFDQLQRSHRKLLDGDADFKEAVFEMVLEDPPKFKQARDFLKLNEIRQSPKAWAKLTSVPGPAGLEQAQRVIAAERLDAERDPIGKLERAVKALEDIAGAPELWNADSELLGRFHHLSGQIPAGPSDPQWKFERMREWLDEMTVEQVAELGDGALEGLAQAQERVQAMAEAWAQRHDR